MGISPSLILSLLALVAVGCAMALGATPHSSAMASRVVFWAFPSFASVALVLNILELRRESRHEDGFDWRFRASCSSVPCCCSCGKGAA